MKKETIMKQEAEQMSTKISNVSFQLREEKERTQARLEDLRKALPDILADWALGLAPREKVDEIKKAIAEAEEFLRDYPLIDQALD